MKIFCRIVLLLFADALFFAHGLIAADLPKVFFIGDTYSSAYFPFLKKGLERTFVVQQKQLKEEADSEKRWKSAEGDSREVAVYLRNCRIKGSIQANVLLINCGLQDTRQNLQTGELAVGLEEYRANLRSIISEARKMKMEPLWYNSVPVADSIKSQQTTVFHRTNTDVELYNQAAAEVMAQEKVNVIDFNTFCRNFIKWTLDDSRPNDPKIAQKQGEYLAESLNQWWVACAVSNPAIKRERLWPEIPPLFENTGFERVNGSARIDHVTMAEVERFYPKKGNAATAVIFFPGGGYKFLGFLRNAKDLADKLEPLGIAVIGLKYRTGRTQDVPLLDALRAVRYVRAHAKEWGIDPNRIGVAGQSAGANLVLNLAGNYSEGDRNANDPVERESSRPDFMAVFSSWNFGSNESTFVFKKDMPPFFIRHAKDDSSFQLIQKVVSQLDETGVSKDVVFLEKGGHGAFEIDPRNTGYKWPDDFVNWLKKLNLW